MEAERMAATDALLEQFEKLDFSESVFQIVE